MAVTLRRRYTPPPRELGSSSLRIFLRRFVVALRRRDRDQRRGRGRGERGREPEVRRRSTRITTPEQRAVAAGQAGRAGELPDHRLRLAAVRRHARPRRRRSAATTDVGSARSDVMMVVHVVPALGTAFVVSFPRDTVRRRSRATGTTSSTPRSRSAGPRSRSRPSRKTSASRSSTTSRSTSSGFQKIVDAIGHVKIYFPTPARDFYTGLDEPVAGLPVAQRRARRSRTRGRATTRSRARA